MFSKDVDMLLEVSNIDYYIFIVTNKNKTLLRAHAGCDFKSCLQQLQQISDKYSSCIYLVYWEKFSNAAATVLREQEFNQWSKRRKMSLINSVNPGYNFLNDIFD